MITVKEFCDKYNACKPGARWGMQFFTMHEAYEAFLHGEGDFDYMVWTYCHAVSPIDATKFACWCVRQNWDLLIDEKSRKAIEVAEAWTRGEIHFVNQDIVNIYAAAHTAADTTVTHNVNPYIITAAHAAAYAADTAYEANAATHAKNAHTIKCSAYRTANSAIHTCHAVINSCAKNTLVYRKSSSYNKRVDTAVKKVRDHLIELGNPF
jgi:hypothetical protein